VILPLLLVLSQAVAAATVGDECVEPQNQLAMNMCALADYEAADTEMNRQWAETAAAMKEADAELDREYDTQPGYYETLLEGQRAWLKFRDAQCLLESFDFRGGSGQPMIDSGCKARVTRERTRELRVLVLGPEGE
jgi:uncharacterized protein YecT (DUF1311 family)